MIFMIMLLALMAVVPLVIHILEASHRGAKHELYFSAQANNVAKAGLADAMAWFRRQAIQPVRSSSNPTAYPYPDAAFFPRNNGVPSTTDTLDESIGLTKEYAMTDNSRLWAHYEVRRQQDPATNSWVDHAVHDITGKRLTCRS